MTSRYPLARRNSNNSNSSSDCSDGSEFSDSTAPTVYSGRPSIRQYATDISQYKVEKNFDSFFPSSDGRQSVGTYASTTPSEADFDEAEDLEYPVYDDPADYEPQEPAAVPSTPPEFAEYFPSTRRLCIRHDDTVDGNMNLRIDTETHRSGDRKVDLTLFHLRMHDLKNRQFSLRRYCRDSGREVCHSTRRYTKPASERRPGLQRSMSNALASLRSKSDSKTFSKSALKRVDSGYDSMSEEEDNDEDQAKLPTPANLPMPTNTMNLEFSNYAHVDLKRRGAKSSKRYEFEYWGTAYAWKRVAKKDGDSKEISYHLYNSCTGSSVAHIVPAPMTPDEAHDEEAKGGWVPPCSMWISDAQTLSGLTDVADVIVSTGLMALVDDCIKNRWHRKDRFQFPVPLPLLSASKKLNMEYVGPKRLLDEVFNRRASSGGRSSPLRQVLVKS